MAKPIELTSTILSIFFPCFHYSLSGESQDLSRKLSRESLGMKYEKLSHLHFYFHDIVSGRNPTTVQVAATTMANTSATGFGAVVMIADTLTLKPELNSTEVGRAQWIHALTSQKDKDGGKYV